MAITQVRLPHNLRTRLKITKKKANEQKYKAMVKNESRKWNNKNSLINFSGYLWPKYCIEYSNNSWGNQSNTGRI